MTTQQTIIAINVFLVLWTDKQTDKQTAIDVDCRVRQTTDDKESLQLVNQPLIDLGSGSEGAQSTLEEIYDKVLIETTESTRNVCVNHQMFFQSMTLEEACKQSLSILKQVMEEKLSATNVEAGSHRPSSILLIYLD